MTTLNIKFEVHEKAIAAIVDFLGVTTKRAHEILTTELRKQGISKTSVIGLAKDDQVMAWVLDHKIVNLSDVAKEYDNHLIVQLSNGNTYTVNLSKGPGYNHTFTKVEEEISKKKHLDTE